MISLYFARTYRTPIDIGSIIQSINRKRKYKHNVRGSNCSMHELAWTIQNDLVNGNNLNKSCTLNQNTKQTNKKTVYVLCTYNECKSNNENSKRINFFWHDIHTLSFSTENILHWKIEIKSRRKEWEKRLCEVYWMGLCTNEVMRAFIIVKTNSSQQIIIMAAATRSKRFNAIIIMCVVHNICM